MVGADVGANSPGDVGTAASGESREVEPAKSTASRIEFGRDQRIALAVAQLIADRRGGGKARVVRIPEHEDRTNPVVELVTEDAVGMLAIEHTLIESYTGQINDGFEVGCFEEPLRAALLNDLPEGSRFDLSLAIRGAKGVRPSATNVAAVAEWVRATVPTLADGRPGVDGAHFASVGPPTLPFEASLYRWPQRLGSSLPTFSVRLATPADLEAHRVRRVGIALDKKLPKLATAARDGIEGVLVLESEDWQLANNGAILEGVRTASAGRDAELPAWIVLWVTLGESATAVVLRSVDTWTSSPFAEEPMCDRLDQSGGAA